MKVLKSALIAASAAAVMAVLGAAPASAAAMNFTWTPAAVGLTGVPIINANNFNVSDYATITVTDAGGDFTETGALNVSGFLNGGTTVLSTGLGTTYSLYYVFSAAGNQGGGIPAPGSSVNGSYSSLNYVLYATPNATPTYTVTTGGVAISGNSGAFALAYGSLVNGGVTLTDVSGVGGGLSPSSNVTVTLNPCTASGQGNSVGTCSGNEGLFFTSPSASTAVLQIGNFSANTAVVTQPDGSHILIDGGGGNITEALAPVPEPVTLSLFGAGLAGAAFVRRRKSKKA